MLDKQFYWNRSRRSDRTNLGNHALESDVFIVYLLFTLPQFSICHYQTRKKKKKINLKPHIPSQKITWSQITNNTKNEKRKVRTFGIGEIGVFSNFSSRHRLEKLVGNKGENGRIQRFWNFQIFRLRLLPRYRSCGLSKLRDRTDGRLAALD